MKFYIADAFTDSLFGGNPAGVVILPEGADFPAEEVMVKTAAELRYSETAFIKKLNEKEFQIRYFTPAAEVELCGHATIASFKMLLCGGYIADNATYINHTLAGDLNIDVKDGFVLMDMATPVKIAEISEKPALDELYRIMGISYDEQLAKGLAMIPQMVSTGLPDIMMPVADEEELEKIVPDFGALTELSRHYEVVGVHAFTCNGRDGMIHARNFAPLYDIDEEAATGTSNGALAFYLHQHGLVETGRVYTVVQGEKMGRPSRISAQVTLRGGAPFVQVGGPAVTLVQGEIDL